MPCPYGHHDFELWYLPEASLTPATISWLWSIILSLVPQVPIAQSLTISPASSLTTPHPNLHSPGVQRDCMNMSTSTVGCLTPPPSSLCPTHVVSSYRKTFHLVLNSPHQPRNDLSIHSTYTNYTVQSQPLKHFVAPLLSCLSPLIRLWAPGGQALVRFNAFAVA